MSNKSLRIKANVGEDNVLRVKVDQDVDTLDILSLKINQTDTYKLHTADYGMIIGRVLANEAFGIPNAKISVFIPITDEDAANDTLRDIYPYASVNDKNNEGIRYNLLPDSYEDDCQKVIGTFPNKRYVLDNNTNIEVYEKYWKYTTVTNSSGDYAIFGVPTGGQELHVDIDLSDVGILSQKPRDFMYKGYNLSQFDNAEQFKDSTNLDSLSQVITQTQAVHVYPFWGDTDMGEIAISRCDVQVQYKFEPTCVFFGGAVTDDYSNSISDKCIASADLGKNRKLISSEGIIEMIRLTPDGLVEEFPIQGNRLIDGDGVWCYQIPMNLDYVSTDEYGNIVPTDNPNKGIPTRTRVRFRFSLSETGNEGVSRHRAKILVPNNPILEQSAGSYAPKIVNFKEYNMWHEFGSATRDSDFRDLYWNNVYSVKSYIPRVQKSSSKSTKQYTSLKSGNWTDNQNPMPYNTIRIKLPFLFKIVCILVRSMCRIVGFLNGFFGVLTEVIHIRIRAFGKTLIDWAPLCKALSCVKLDLGTDETTEDGRLIVFYPHCTTSCLKKKASESNDGAYVETDVDVIADIVQVQLAEDFEIVHLDLSNDWINGTLYFPLWFWRKKKKARYLFGLITKRAVNRYCSCDTRQKKMFLGWPCGLTEKDASNLKYGNFSDPYSRKNSKAIKYGLIKEHENKDGLKIYYYSPGNIDKIEFTQGVEPSGEDLNFTRLFATDIILLGSFNKCSLNPIPDLYKFLPSTSTNVPPISYSYILESDDDVDDSLDDFANQGIILESGMDVRRKADKDMPLYKKGLFYDVSCVNYHTFAKTCINAARMAELGVVMDTFKLEEYPTQNGNLGEWELYVDGMITRFEINDNESRAMFATMNHNGLEAKIINPQTQYSLYKLDYLYPMDFDGRLEKIAPQYTNKMEIRSVDESDQVYRRFRSGDIIMNYDTNDKNNADRFGQVLFNNSFYFYFGIKDGSTAINKLLKNYSSDCYKKVKEYITYDISLNPTTWCKDAQYDSSIFGGVDTENLGKVKFDFEKITTPYTINIIDEFGRELTRGNDYYAATADITVTDGQETYSNFVKIDSDSYDEDIIFITNLHNGKYRIYITDSLGRGVSQFVELVPVTISVTIESSPLGIKFYAEGENQTDKTEVCTPGNYGEVILSDFVLDGITHKAKNVEYYGKESEYVITLDDDTRIHAKLEVTSLLVEDADTMPLFTSECSCKDINTGGVCKVDDCNIVDGKVSFRLWRPSSIQVILTEMCGRDVMSKNIGYFGINVDNGKDFLGFINDAPAEMIYKASSYNGETNKKKWWLNANNPKNWKYFENNGELLNKINLPYYENYVDSIIRLMNEDGSLIGTFDSNLAVVQYKLQSIFKLLYGIYVYNDTSTTMSFTTSGGKKPLINGNYPTYIMMNEEKGLTNYIYNYFSETKNTYVDCDDAYPNIVFKNYMWSMDADLHPHKIKPFSNPYHLNKKFKQNNLLANYFAAFTFYDKNEGGCVTVKTIPNTCNEGDHIVGIDEANRLKQTGYTSIAPKKYFAAEFVDRRVDYSIFVVEAFLDKDNYRGFVSANTYNGVEMVYDERYNVISYAGDENQLEYTYNIAGLYDSDSKSVELIDSDSLDIELNDDCKSKRFYSAEISFGVDKFDVRDKYGKGGGEHEDWTPLSEESTIKYRQLAGTNTYIGNTDTVIERTLTFRDVPPVEKINYTVVPCSVNIEVETEDYLKDPNKTEEYSRRLIGLTSEGPDMSVDVTLRQTIGLYDNSLAKCLEDEDFCNINFVLQDRNITSDYDGILSGDSWTLNTQINPDTKSDNKSYTYKPVVVIDVMDIYKTLSTSDKFFNYKGDVKKRIDEFLHANGKCVEMDFVKDSYEDLDGEPLKPEDNMLISTDNRCTLQTFMPSKKLFTCLGRNNKPLWDDEAVGLKFKQSGSIENKNKSISLLSIRHYFNGDDDNLTKEYVTYNFNLNLDAKPFKIKIFDTWLENMESDEETSDKPKTIQRVGFYIYNDSSVTDFEQRNILIDAEMLTAVGRCSYKYKSGGIIFKKTKEKSCQAAEVIVDKLTNENDGASLVFKYKKVKKLETTYERTDTDPETGLPIKTTGSTLTYPEAEMVENAPAEVVGGFRVVATFNSDIAKVNISSKADSDKMRKFMFFFQHPTGISFSTKFMIYPIRSILEKAGFRDK